jgi:GDPmannose 4,6-dehydratase
MSFIWGNLEARRDWGFAGDYVQAIWRMLQQDHADDCVVGTGIDHSVAEFVHIAFDSAGLNWKNYVNIDSALFRPAEADNLRADPAKARRVLNWTPKVSFSELIFMMVDHEIYRLKKGLPAYVVVAGNA